MLLLGLRSLIEVEKVFCVDAQKLKVLNWSRKSTNKRVKKKRDRKYSYLQSDNVVGI